MHLHYNTHLETGIIDSYIYYLICFFSISLTVGASRLMEAQIDLPRLLFGVGCNHKRSISIDISIIISSSIIISRSINSISSSSRLK